MPIIGLPRGFRTGAGKHRLFLAGGFGSGGSRTSLQRHFEAAMKKKTPITVRLTTYRTIEGGNVWNVIYDENVSGTVFVKETPNPSWKGTKKDVLITEIIEEKSKPFGFRFEASFEPQSKSDKALDKQYLNPRELKIASRIQSFMDVDASGNASDVLRDASVTQSFESLTKIVGALEPGHQIDLLRTFRQWGEKDLAENLAKTLNVDITKKPEKTAEAQTTYKKIPAEFMKSVPLLFRDDLRDVHKLATQAEPDFAKASKILELGYWTANAQAIILDHLSKILASTEPARRIIEELSKTRPDKAKEVAQRLGVELDIENTAKTGTQAEPDQSFYYLATTPISAVLTYALASKERMDITDEAIEDNNFNLTLSRLGCETTVRIFLEAFQRRDFSIDQMAMIIMSIAKERRLEFFNEIRKRDPETAEKIEKSLSKLLHLESDQEAEPDPFLNSLSSHPIAPIVYRITQSEVVSVEKGIELHGPRETAKGLYRLFGGDSLAEIFLASKPEVRTKLFLACREVDPGKAEKLKTRLTEIMSKPAEETQEETDPFFKALIAHPIQDPPAEGWGRLTEAVERGDKTYDRDYGMGKMTMNRLFMMDMRKEVAAKIILALSPTRRKEFFLELEAYDKTYTADPIRKILIKMMKIETVEEAQEETDQFFAKLKELAKSRGIDERLFMPVSTATSGDYKWAAEEAVQITKNKGSQTEKIIQMILFMDAVYRKPFILALEKTDSTISANVRSELWRIIDHSPEPAKEAQEEIIKCPPGVNATYFWPLLREIEDRNPHETASIFRRIGRINSRKEQIIIINSLPQREREFLLSSIEQWETTLFKQIKTLLEKGPYIEEIKELTQDRLFANAAAKLASLAKEHRQWQPEDFADILRALEEHDIVEVFVELFRQKQMPNEYPSKIAGALKIEFTKIYNGMAARGRYSLAADTILSKATAPGSIANMIVELGENSQSAVIRAMREKMEKGAFEVLLKILREKGSLGLKQLENSGYLEQLSLPKEDETGNGFEEKLRTLIFEKNDIREASRAIVAAERRKAKPISLEEIIKILEGLKLNSETLTDLLGKMEFENDALASELDYYFFGQPAVAVKPVQTERPALNEADFIAGLEAMPVEEAKFAPSEDVKAVKEAIIKGYIEWAAEYILDMNVNIWRTEAMLALHPDARVRVFKKMQQIAPEKAARLMEELRPSLRVETAKKADAKVEEKAEETFPILSMPDGLYEHSGQETWRRTVGLVKVALKGSNLDAEKQRKILNLFADPDKDAMNGKIYRFMTACDNKTKQGKVGLFPADFGLEVQRRAKKMIRTFMQTGNIEKAAKAFYKGDWKKH